MAEDMAIHHRVPDTVYESEPLYNQLVVPGILDCHKLRCDLPGVQITLENSDLWHEFNKNDTEMIITKKGRRLFPDLRLRISGLDPDSRYYVILEMTLASGRRYKHVSSGWKAAGQADAHVPPFSSRSYILDQSPALGSQWMNGVISSLKARLTNSHSDNPTSILLSSMHKYVPLIHVVLTSDMAKIHTSPSSVFSFPETRFIAVTAYQSRTMIKLKVKYNPFAKGHREDSQAKRRRKRANPEEIGGDPPEARIELVVTPSTSDSLSSVLSSVGSTDSVHSELQVVAGAYQSPASYLQQPYFQQQCLYACIAARHSFIMSFPSAFAYNPFPYLSPLSIPYVPPPPQEPYLMDLSVKGKP